MSDERIIVCERRVNAGSSYYFPHPVSGMAGLRGCRAGRAGAARAPVWGARVTRRGRGGRVPRARGAGCAAM